MPNPQSAIPANTIARPPKNTSGGNATASNEVSTNTEPKTIEEPACDERGDSGRPHAYGVENGDDGGRHNVCLGQVVGDERKVGISGGDEGGTGDIRPEDARNALAFELGTRDLEIAGAWILCARGQHR